MKLAIYFPGQGAQTLGMGKDFFENFKEAKLVFEEASDAANLNLKKLCFDGPESELVLTANLQPALFTVEVAIWRSLQSETHLDVAAAAGHSLGEYSAWAASGALTLADGARITRLRGEAMQRAVPAGRGAMAAILGLSTDLVAKLCTKATSMTQKIVDPANFNAPGQVVIAGETEAVNAARDLLKSDPEFAKAKAIPLQVSAPFHCRLMKPAREELKRVLLETDFQDAKFPVVANVTAGATKRAGEIPGLLSDQVTGTVRWEECATTIKRLFRPDLALELGPGKVLAGLQKRIDDRLQVRNVQNVEQMREILEILKRPTP